MTEDERRAYEADLEAVLGYLDNPPAPGSPEDQDFALRMRRVQAAEADFTADSESGIFEEPAAPADKYRQRLAALRAATERPEKQGFTEGGDDGLGPTLGMDLGRNP